MSFLVGVKSFLFRKFSRGKNILFVFEELNERCEMTLFFERKFRVETADSGKSALKRIEKGEKVDLVVIDRLMPHMSGVELTEKIKIFSPDIFVIISSSAYHDGIRATNWAREEGADDGFSKDCQLTILLEKIENLLADCSSR